ncbi:MAG: hypothetical protein IT368_00795 [Candidatus Hydrogenedentes bacterium]|nr:hypothetical protein [Candidatus Hydrogenedentota bacterium]
MMKLRIQGNSLRLRLQQREVAELHECGRLSESLVLGTGPEETFTYSLERHPGATVQILREPTGLVVRLPAAWAADLAETDQVGVDVEVPVAPGAMVRVKIEKDYACLTERPGEDERDAFPHPEGPCAGR